MKILTILAVSVALLTFGAAWSELRPVQDQWVALADQPWLGC